MEVNRDVDDYTDLLLMKGQVHCYVYLYFEKYISWNAPTQMLFPLQKSQDLNILVVAAVNVCDNMPNLKNKSFVLAMMAL